MIKAEFTRDNVTYTRVSKSKACKAFDKFQFHTGSIKGAGRSAFTPIALPGFNSTLVRLKACCISLCPSCRSRFQFHTGSIKGDTD